MNITSKKILNEYRNFNYNSPDKNEALLAHSINAILMEIANKDKLIELYKRKIELLERIELAEFDDFSGPFAITRDSKVFKEVEQQIKHLEGE